MKIILLSGGSGKRLWPLSNEVRSKQFLKLLESPNGGRESMIQRVVRQITDAGLSDSITIATSAKQVDFIQNQLGKNVDVVTEPSRRDTFPAIALACTYLAKDKGVSLDEPVVVMPCDTYTEPRYFEVIRSMAQAVEQDAAGIVLMGIEPESPSSKYGYILPEATPTGHNWLSVKGFKEKPAEDVAKALIAEGALWNGGVFAFRLGYLTRIVEKYIDAKSYAQLAADYDQLPKISFDYEVVEKAKSIAVVPFKGLWKDLGTWDALAENLPENSMGHVLRDDTTVNTHVINELDIPIICAGTQNMVIAATCDGILIARKDASDGIKSKVDGLNARPMFEERRWGYYRVIGRSEFPDGHRSLTKLLHINPGCSISYQIHNHRSEVWTFIDGDGDLVVDGIRRRVSAGDVAVINRGQKHTIRAVTPLEIVEVQSGNPLVEEDIIRFDWNWD